MTSPLPHGEPNPAAADRRKLARKWAYLISLTSYVPGSHARVEEELLDLVNRVFDAMTSEPLPTDRIARIGARLVELHCVGTASLPCTVEVLAAGLLSDPRLRRIDRLPERVMQLIGALASGYVEAIRASTMEQQDALHRALLEAMWVADRKLRTSESRLDEVLTGATNGIAITDLDGRFVRVNTAFGRILDRSSGETTRSTLFDLVRPRDRIDLRAAYRELLEGKRDRLELRPWLLRDDGAALRISLSASLLRHADGQASDYVTIVVDETEPAVLRRQLDDQALRDAVTGLPNRRDLTTRLTRLLHAATPTTLYALELDGFSLLTDRIGRDAGDDLLRAVAQRLLAMVDDLPGATVARLDGATFAILVESAPETATMIGLINRTLGEPVGGAAVRMPVSVSIGVVHQPSRDAAPADLINAADLALRRAKSRGCGQWALFDPERDHLGPAETAPGDWDVGRLRVGYRPVVRLADEHLLAFEALPRWDPGPGTPPHRRRAVLAEHTGLILPAGSRLLRLACEQLRRQREVPVHVNLTANQSADRDLVDRVTRALHDTGAPPARLHIGVPLADLRRDRGTVDNLSGLAGAGVQICVHHFDGAPEDLACLEDVTAPTVRLAPSLVRRQTRQYGTVLAKIVPDLIALIHTAGATVVVDDLPTRVQAHWWHQAGADAATGPMFAGAARQH